MSKQDSEYRGARPSALAAFVALILVVPALTGGTSSSPPSVSLLTDVPVTTPPPTPFARATLGKPVSKPWIRHQRSVAVNHTALDLLNQSSGPSQPAVTMDLFDARPHLLELESARQGLKHARIWRGKFRGEPTSDVNLVSHEGTVIGTIFSNDHVYKIESDGSGRQQLVEIDVDALPPDHHPVVVPDSAADVAPAPAIAQEETATSPTALADDGTQVDLLVVYTATAKDQEGGQAAIEALIALGVDSANQAYSNSQINMQLRLVHTAEVSYTESGSIDTDLTRLRNTSDGIMDQVHQLRDQYKADLVALVVDNGGGFCGIAYVMTNGPKASFASSAFSVTARDCIANHTLAHEMGHNMGDAHDRATGGTGVFAYSYGYRDEVGKFRTIMAYACPTVSCPRVKYFSNPRVQVNGRPAGVDHTADPANSADNARSMNEARQTIANWRVSGVIDTTPPAAPMNLRILTP